MRAPQQQPQLESTNIPANVMQEMDELEDSMKSQSSVRQEKSHSERFMKFLTEKTKNIDLKTVSEKELNELLRWFYKELRTKKNKYYSPSSLTCIRAGIHRYLTTTLNRSINIISGEQFNQANRMLKTMTALWLSSGGKLTEYIAIEKTDMTKIQESFTRKNAESLQNEVILPGSKGSRGIEAPSTQRHINKKRCRGKTVCTNESRGQQ